MSFVVYSDDVKIHWLPYRRQTFYTRLPLDEAVQALSAHIVSRRFRLWAWSDRGKFEGNVSSSGFKINRVPTYRGWFPTVVGTFKPLDSGTQIDIEMKSSWIALAFWIYMGVLLLAIGYQSIVSGEFMTFITQNGGCFILPLGAMFFVLVWLMSMLFFNYEVGKAYQFLQQVLALSAAD